MATNPEPRTLSIEQYLLLMRNSDRRYEYYDGRLRAMDGGTSNHAKISGNMYVALDQALGDDAVCVAYIADKMVRVAEKKIVLPDVVVSCDRSDHGEAQIIESPRLVVEVLSRTTETQDRAIKLPLYQSKETVQEIVLISQAVQWVEIFTRKDGDWLYHQYGAGQRFTLESLDVEIEVVQLYRRLSIPVVVEEPAEET